ncbi:cobyric acid synthase [Phocaeicola oris]|uniref:cobyric acid synthase n=2 Tax=Phocaeicola TaxID=909656 RepID=UPI0038B2E5EF
MIFSLLEDMLIHHLSFASLCDLHYLCRQIEVIMECIPQFLIAAPTSGSGKTTIARGLMGLFVRHGMNVQPFKCGPDYIDTKFHKAVCVRPSLNLDSFMASSEHLHDIYNYYSMDADVCVVEGMMGLFDGYNRSKGSSAEVAMTLDLPVVMVVDAKSVAYSLAPLLSGFKNFNKDVRIVGVIFNKVGSSHHFDMLKQVCEDLQLTCFGYLPKNAELEQSSRYLGLDFSKADQSVDLLIDQLEHFVDWKKLLRMTTREVPCSIGDYKKPCEIFKWPFGDGGKIHRVLIARNDESFSFIYEEHLAILFHLGCDINFFNPEDDESIPFDIDLLYLPGGYPEKHLKALQKAKRTRESIRRYAENGGRILAECGGMMYLCESIVSDDGKFDMVGALPYTVTARKENRKLSLGYRMLHYNNHAFRGHEFHYTQFLGEVPTSNIQVYNAMGKKVSTPFFKENNILAGYTHLYWGSDGITVKDVSCKRSKIGQKYKLHPVMFAGTGSDVGKSIIAAAFCRIFKQDGYYPAPFKAQNMALNSFATPDGLEIGRAQAVQAEAAGIPCSTDMNPVLLKPNSDHTSQVVLNGRPLGNCGAYDYFRKNGREALRKEVHAAFDRLNLKYNPIVMEGAGSISEINLRDSDLVNLPMALYAGADVILVGDIDRGGVFGSVYGSIALLSPTERNHIKGIIINKFRGDLRLFKSGAKMLEDLCHIPVLGVIPYYNDIYIEEEDSVDLASKSMQSERGKVNVAVVLLRHLSNFTDFNVLERDPRVHLFYTNNVDDILKADIIILPGSKSTIADLYELRRNGVAQAVVRAHREGASVMGICGGFQLMGQEVLDPEHVEGDIERLPGLGLLPTTTRMEGDKVTRQVKFRSVCSETQEYNLEGYEIHMGRTTPFGDVRFSPLNKFDDGHTDGWFIDNKCMGTYIHGILDNPEFIDFLLSPFADKMKEAGKPFDYHTFKEEQYDKLADHVRSHVNMKLIYKILRGHV